MTADQIVAVIFAYLFYPVVGWALVSGYLQDKFSFASAHSILSGVWSSALIRAALVSLIGQGVVTMLYQTYDNRLLLFVVCTLSAIAMTSRPAGRLSALVASVFIAQVVFCIVYLVQPATLSAEITYSHELKFWRSNMFASLVLIALLAGASCGKTGRDFVDRMRGRAGVLLSKARGRKLAR